MRSVIDHIESTDMAAYRFINRLPFSHVAWIKDDELVGVTNTLVRPVLLAWRARS